MKFPNKQIKSDIIEAKFNFRLLSPFFSGAVLFFKSAASPFAVQEFRCKMDHIEVFVLEICSIFDYSFNGLNEIKQKQPFFRTLSFSGHFSSTVTNGYKQISIQTRNTDYWVYTILMRKSEKWIKARPSLFLVIQMFSVKGRQLNKKHREQQHLKTFLIKFFIVRPLFRTS